MFLTPHPEEQLRTLAWYGIAVVAGYYFLAGIALRWRSRRRVRVARYEPPSGVSPAVAAYLWERGVTDKPFVVALLNMASKGWLKIEQGPNDYLLSRADASMPLEDEEQVIAESLFRGKGPSVCLSQLFRLVPMARSVRGALESAVEPDLISAHFAGAVPGIVLSLWSFLAALYPEIDGLRQSQAGPTVIVPAFIAVWALLATIKTLPATFYKLVSHLPGRTPRPLPLVKRDRTILIMLLVAAAALAIIAWISSPVFALQFGAFLLVNLLGVVALRAPTAAGYAMLQELADFRMFLAEVDADRVNRVNAPGAPSAAAEKYWGWTLALNVEHAWGEQFAAAVLNLLGPVSALASIEGGLPENGRTSAKMVDLNLRSPARRV